jgi:plasmid stabilization system protein ParE
MAYSVLVEANALRDIQKAIDYYDVQQIGLGKKFEQSIHKSIAALIKNPFYQIRYDEIRCLPLKKFPFMIHFDLQETNQAIRIIAVFHTSLSPAKWLKK